MVNIDTFKVVTPDNKKVMHPVLQYLQLAWKTVKPDEGEWKTWDPVDPHAKRAQEIAVKEEEMPDWNATSPDQADDTVGTYCRGSDVKTCTRPRRCNYSWG